MVAYIRKVSPSHFLCLISSAERPNLTVYPSLTSSFATNSHLNFPRPAPIWPCSSVGRATVICSRGRGFESHRCQRFFLLSPCGSISFLELSLRRYYLEYLHSTSTHLNHFLCLLVPSRCPNPTGYPFTSVTKSGQQSTNGRPKR